MVLDQTLTVDTDAKTITLSDGSGALGAKTLSGARAEWLRLQPGDNTLTFTDVGTVYVQIEVLWDVRYVE